MTTNNFSHAKEEIERQRPQKSSRSAYQLAFTDDEFMLREELRPVRLQLELLKPEMIMNELDIESTVVFYGSARTSSPEQANIRLNSAKEALQKDPNNSDLKRAVLKAKKDKQQSIYYEESCRLAKLISEENKGSHPLKNVVMTGGGPGIMEAANRGASMADAKNIGLNIVLPMEQGHNDYISEELCFQFHYFAIRKMHFLLRAKAVVVFPGGFGTLDELFENLTLTQTRKMHPVPVYLFGKEFWERVINFNTLIEEGYINPEDLNLFEYVSSASEAWEKIKALD